MPTTSKKQKLLDAGLLKPDADEGLVDKMLKSLSYNDVDEIIRVLGKANFADDPIPIIIVPDTDPIDAAARQKRESAKQKKETKKKRKK